MSISVLNTDASLSGKTIMAKEVSETVSGVKTFSAAPVFSVAPVVNAGLAFPATQNASADPNNLDDYEEGSFTPTLVSAGGGTPSYSVQSGVYTKVGRVVHFQLRVTLSGLGSLAAGAMTIAGLPFTANASTALATAPFGFYGGLATSIYNIFGFILGSSTSVSIYILTAAATSPTAMNKTDLGAGADFVCGGSYIV